MYKLYYSAGACSMTPHVVLNELNVPYALVDANKAGTKDRSPEFLKDINPRGAVPVLSDDGFIIREGAAILIYLLDKHKSPLLPQSGHERAAALEWLCFANATLHPAYAKAFGAGKFQDKAVQDAVYKSAFEQINKLWAELDARLAKNKYVCGDAITAADILITVIANWSGYFPQGAITLGSNVKRLLKEVSSRPSYQKALKDEQVEYKAAA